MRVAADTARGAGDAPLKSLQLPQYIGVLDYMGERTRPAGMPAGTSYSYRAAGIGLDIDISSAEAAHLPAGIDSAAFERQYRRAQHDKRFPALDHGARLLRQDIAQLGTHRHFAARESVFAVHDADFTGTVYLWLANVHGTLLEARLAVRKGFEEDGRVSRVESLAALGQAIVHSEAAQPTPPETPHLSIAIEWDPSTPAAERKLWMTYLYVRAAHAAVESEHRALPLGVQQPSFEDEVRARRVVVGLYRRMHAHDPGFHSAYFAALSRVAAAGFLREYVWRYLRNPSWTTRPDGLRLAAFDKWRAIHLVGHVAITHGSIALRVASR